MLQKETRLNKFSSNSGPDLKDCLVQFIGKYLAVLVVTLFESIYFFVCQ